MLPVLFSLLPPFLSFFGLPEGARINPFEPGRPLNACRQKSFWKQIPQKYARFAVCTQSRFAAEKNNNRIYDEFAARKDMQKKSFLAFCFAPRVPFSGSLRYP
ncbi:MAG: hypothetical protein ACLFNW_03255 [Desulfobacterales bacterium]